MNATLQSGLFCSGSAAFQLCPANKSAMKPSFIFRVTLLAIIIAALASCQQSNQAVPAPLNVHRMDDFRVKETGPADVQVVVQVDQLVSRFDRGYRACADDH
jgi:hypothetical protein